MDDSVRTTTDVWGHSPFGWPGGYAEELHTGDYTSCSSLDGHVVYMPCYWPVIMVHVVIYDSPAAVESSGYELAEIMEYHAVTFDGCS